MSATRRSLVRTLMLLAIAAPQAFPSVARGAQGPATRENVAWRNGAVELKGTLHLPSGPGPHPAMVFLHGSGDEGRSGLGYLLYAGQFAKRGIATLLYDKRGVGQSTGSWREGDYRDLAMDAVKGIEMLAKRPDIDATKLGLIGTSEGGWTASLAASLTPKVAFLVMISGPPMPPVEQEYFEVETEMRVAGAAEADIKEALQLLRIRRQACRTEQWDDLQAAIEAARARPWFEKWGEAKLPDFNDARLRWYQRVMDYDPLPVLRSLDVPVFAAYGEKDVLVPARRSVDIMKRIRDEQGKDFTILLLPDVGHTLRRSGVRWPDAFWEHLSEWLDKQLGRAGVESR